ncbi:hypothetical protein NUM3379_19190 [Kineococcus sp. NUM-3379]
MAVFTLENGMLSIAGPVSHISGATERIVKYMAKSPAKNMSSLDNHTITPTDTTLGRLTEPWAGLGVLLWTACALATIVIIAPCAA